MKTFGVYFQYYFLKSFEVVKLNEKVIKELADDQRALPYSLIVLVLPSLLNFGMASLAYRVFALPEFVLLIVFVLLNVIILLFMGYLAQSVFRGKPVFGSKGFLINAAFTNVLMWILLIPIVLLLIGVPIEKLFMTIGSIVGIWTLVVYFKLLRILYELSWFKIFVIVVIGIFGTFALQGFLMDIFLGEEYKSVLLNGVIT